MIAQMASPIPLRTTCNRLYISTMYAYMNGAVYIYNVCIFIYHAITMPQQFQMQ